MGKSVSLLLTGASLVTFALTGLAQAGSPLSVTVDRSQLMELTSDPSTIIVGNPSIADVSLNGRQLFIHGRSAGETNLLVFDQGGGKIADFDLSVGQDGSNSVVVFTGSTNAGTSRFSYVCAPTCERSMMVGDTSGAFSTLVSDNQSKNGFAQGAGKSSSSQQGHTAPAQ